VLCAALGLGSGCTTKVLELGSYSKRPLDPQGWVTMQKGRERISAESSGMMILFFPVGQADVQKAMQAAQDACQCDVLTDVVVDFSYFTGIFFAKFTYTVSGLPARFVPYRNAQKIRPSVGPQVLPPAGTPLPAHLRPGAR
jgi:hypothetical protein